VLGFPRAVEASLYISKRLLNYSWGSSDIAYL
jgi:hypothetical protein